MCTTIRNTLRQNDDNFFRFDFPNQNFEWITLLLHCHKMVVMVTVYVVDMFVSRRTLSEIKMIQTESKLEMFPDHRLMRPTNKN